jgi:hypothetical protein
LAVPQREIALIFDFDDTLAEDSTAAFVKSRGLDPESFYAIAGERITQGWDPPLAYLTLLCDYVRDRKLPALRKSDLRNFGKRFKPFPGVPEFLRNLRRRFEQEPRLQEAELHLSYYMISGGIGDIVRSVSIAPLFKEIWACEFDYDSRGVLSRPKAVITFTEKTKYLFYINKGISGAQSRETPYAVNAELSQEDRPVPFSNMVYVGDGASDVPCMSVLRRANPPGRSILVWGRKKFHKAWELLERGTPVHRDFQRNGAAREAIETTVLHLAIEVAERIINAKKRGFAKEVGYATVRNRKKPSVGDRAKES